MSLLPSSTGVLKPLIKYLQQSRQIEKVDPVMSYYCRLYALQLVSTRRATHCMLSRIVSQQHLTSRCSSLVWHVDV
jgi:hypothetical protein